MKTFTPNHQHEALLEALRHDSQFANISDVLQDAMISLSRILSPQVAPLDQELQAAFQRILIGFGVDLDQFFKIIPTKGSQDAVRRERILSLLKSLPLFRDASDYDLVFLSMHMQEREIPADTNLLVQDQPVENVFFIVQGAVDILVNNELVAERGEGEVVGEFSCLHNELYASATVIARTSCRVLGISREKFMEIGISLPKIWRMLFDNMRIRVVDLNSRYSELLNSSCQGVVKLDTQGRVTSKASQQGLHLLGITKGDGQMFASLLFRNDTKAMQDWADTYAFLVKQPLAEFHKVVERLPRTVRHVHQDMGERYYFLHYFPSYRVNDQLVSVSVCIDDRTEIIRVSEELKTAMVLSEQANQAKTFFIAKMSHEMRTPLNGVIGYAELLQRHYSALDSQVEHYADKIIWESRILLDMINSLLDMSKIAAGKLVLDSYPFSLLQILEYVHSVMGMRARQKGLEYTCTVAPEVPVNLLGDSLRLRQVILNLVGNAIKFTEQGAVGMVVSSVQMPDDKVMLRFEIQDTGIGILEEHQSLIFDSFSQADSSITRKFGGTGLGTTISRELVSLMEGEIGLRSIWGKGSTFWFTVCLEKISESMVITTLSEQEEVHDSAVAAEQLRWKGRILLCEDYKTNQLVFTEQLHNRGCEVVIADNGQIGVNLFSAESFDLVLMDVHMPVMDGLTATQLMRHQEATRGAKRTPIIALTAAVYASDRQKCRDAGMDDFLEKPLRQSQLIAKLLKWLGPGEVPADTPVQLTDADEPMLPEALPGLEIRRASRILACGPGIYLEIVTCYYREHAGIIQAMRAAFAGHEWSKLEKLAHSLKGTSAAIGAYVLHGHALELEKRSREAESESPPLALVDQVDTCYQQVMASLTSLLVQTKRPKPARSSVEPLAPEALAEMLRHFSEAIMTADLASIRDRLTTFKKYCNDEALCRLEEELDNYDYEDALATLQEIAVRIRATL